MSKTHETTTNRLVSIIQAIQLERGTGLLTAKRGEGIGQEEGTIVFANGQVTQVSTGRRSGSDALNWLSTWGVCRYTFVSSSVSRSTQPLAATTPNTPSQLPVYGEQRARPVTQGAESKHKIPTRVSPLNDALHIIEQRGYSRAHRLLLFWIDGARPPSELANLMKCDEKEVRALLRDLEKAGVIQFIS